MIGIDTLAILIAICIAMALSAALLAVGLLATVVSLRRRAEVDTPTIKAYRFWGALSAGLCLVLILVLTMMGLFAPDFVIIE